MDALPTDMVKYELLPKMSIEDLSNLIQTSRRYRELGISTLKERIQEGALQKEFWGPESVYNLAAPRPYLHSLIIEYLLKQVHRKEDVFGFFLRNPNHLTPGGKIALSRNPNVSIEEMENNPTLFPPAQFIYNPNITPEYVNSHPNLPWTGAKIVKRNTNFPAEIYKTAPLFQNALNVWILVDNDNVIFPEVKGYENHEWDSTQLMMTNPNFTTREIPLLKEYMPNTLEEDLREDYVSNYNLNLETELTSEIIDKINDQVEEALINLTRHPNATLKRIKAHPEIEWVEEDLLANSNFTSQEAVEHFSVDFNSEFAIRNPNLTLEYIEQHPELDWDYHELSQTKFAKHPAYQKVVYRYIYKLLPEKVTVRIGDKTLAESKDFVYGLLAAIHILHLNYPITYIASDGQEIPLQTIDYKMFTSGDGHQPYLVKMRGFPFHFTTLDFLSGVTTAYESNNIPFDIKKYWDKDAKYTEVRIQ